MNGRAILRNTVKIMRLLLAAAALTTEPQPGVNFIKPNSQNLYIKNAKILMAFALFNFIKTLTPKIHNIVPKNDGTFNVKFYNTKLALKMPTGVTKMPNGQQKCLNQQHVAQYLLPKRVQKVAFSS